MGPAGRPPTRKDAHDRKSAKLRDRFDGLCIKWKCGGGKCDRHRPISPPDVYRTKRLVNLASTWTAASDTHTSPLFTSHSVFTTST